MEVKEKISPFLNWAGGKRWLVENNHLCLPPTFNNYIEPFVGSGAVFFHLSPKKSIISDSNTNLIDTYIAIKKDWKAVYKYLELFQGQHCSEFYYNTRNTIAMNKFEKAAIFIYLNRTCWNGLYRVNKKGVFNVPIGTKKNVTQSIDRFDKVSALLQNTIVISCDFEETIKKAKKNDFLFIDPPYTVNHSKNGFLKYNEKLFTWEDQVRLRNLVLKAKKRGAYIFITNAYHKSIEDLYKDDFIIKEVKRKSVISANSKYRNICSEYIIRSY